MQIKEKFQDYARAKTNHTLISSGIAVHNWDE